MTTDLTPSKYEEHNHRNDRCHQMFISYNKELSNSLQLYYVREKNGFSEKFENRFNL